MVEGSLTNGVDVRLDSGTSVEDIKVGAFVTIQGSRHRFFGVITDVALGTTDPRMKNVATDAQDPFISRALLGTVAYASISVMPNLTMPMVLGDVGETPAAAKTIPPHFSQAYAASDQDVAMVFGKEDERHFGSEPHWTWKPRLCLDLEELVKRSIGVFGKSGTGKTF